MDLPQEQSAITNTQPPIPQPLPEIIGTQKKFPWLVVIFATLFVITLIAGTFFFLRMQSLQKQLSMVPSPSTTTEQTVVKPIPSSSSLPIPSNDPTADWKTYTNQALGFELKYPGAVKIDKEMNDEHNKATIFKGGNLHFEVMLRDAKYYSGPLDKYYYMDNSDFTKSSLGGNVSNVYTQDMSQINCVNDGSGPSCPTSYVVYVASQGAYLYHLGFYGDAILSEIEEQILSTFRFTNAASIICAGSNNLPCPTGFACKLNTPNKISEGGICVDEAETNP